jgi:hypothetical protein
MSHDIIAPSGLDITVQCPRSVGLQMGLPDLPTEESMEGDAAHWLAMMTANGIPMPVGTPCPNGVLVDQDMIDGAELWADIVGPYGEAERKVRIVRIHPRHCGGTPDNYRHDPIAQTVRVFDYKYGHRFVEVFENKQLAAYATGIIDELNLPQAETWVEFVLVQPRSYHPDGPVRRWTVRASDLVGLVNQIHAQVGKAIDENGVPKPDAPAQTGENCRDCKARHLCTLFQRNAASLVDAAGRADLFELPPAQLGAELSYLDGAIQRLKGRRDGLSIQAENSIRSGVDVPGYEMGEGRSTEQWREDADVDTVSAFGAAMGVALCADVKLRTPTQAKAELKRRHLPPELLDAYTHRPRGKMSLTQSSTIKARKAFGATSK